MCVRSKISGEFLDQSAKTDNKPHTAVSGNKPHEAVVRRTPQNGRRGLLKTACDETSTTTQCKPVRLCRITICLGRKSITRGYRPRSLLYEGRQMRDARTNQQTTNETMGAYTPPAVCVFLGAYCFCRTLYMKRVFKQKRTISG